MLSVISTRSTFPPKEKFETGDVSFSAFQPNLSMDNHNEATINVSWKSNREKIINVAFGASTTACNKEQKNQLIAI